MKTFKFNLKTGDTITFLGARLVRDGQGTHVYDADDNVVATFDSPDVASAYEIQPTPE